MFREMRRNRQQLTSEESIAVLERGTCGVLALDGDDGYPYAVPLSYVYHQGKIYFHCAQTGHKIDAMARNHKASFCVVDQDQIVAEEYTTYYRSVIAFGHTRILETTEEKRQALSILAARYSPTQSHRAEKVEEALARVCMVELTIDHLTGKEAKELAAKKRK